MNRETEAGLDRLLTALHDAFQPNRAEVEKRLREILNFHPEDTPCCFTDPDANLMYTGEKLPATTKAKLLKELKEDSEQAFISESYLYNLLGKEDARTLLARMHQLCIALGFEMDKLYDD